MPEYDQENDVIEAHGAVLHAFEQAVGVSFNNKALLLCALMHSSYAKRVRKRKPYIDNERLEFFGDAVLKFIVSEYLYQRFPKYDEGDLSKIRARVVSDRVLAKLASDIRLGEYIFFSYGEQNTGGRTRDSNLANALEAVLGAVYLDQGLLVVRTFFLKLLEQYSSDLFSRKKMKDWKTVLQEMTQKQRRSLPDYSVIKEEGPDHQKIFHVSVRVVLTQGSFKAEGLGVSKKDAEQNAAKALVQQLHPD